MSLNEDTFKYSNSAHLSELNAYRSKIERLSNCIEIANLINSELSIGKLLAKIMKAAKKAFKADAVSMFLIDEKTGDLSFQIASDDTAGEIKEIFRLKKGQGIAGLVAESGIPLNLEDAYPHQKYFAGHHTNSTHQTKAMLCAPLKIRSEIIGVIQVTNKLTPPFVFSNDELEMLITISSSAAVAIDTAQMHQTLLKRETLDRDLRLAREVQESFLPKALPEYKTYRFAALNQPALEIGGDFYNFFKLPANKLGIVLGDVSGKGISASLFMARLTSDLQYFTLLYPEPRQLLTQINNVLCERAKRGMFVTLVYMLLDTVENRIQMANGGHVSPIYFDENGASFLGRESKKGPPLGILPDIEYDQETFSLDENSSVVIYTDGVIEAKNGSSELYGKNRLLRAIETQPNDPDLICKSITDSINQFTINQGRSDDLTLMVFSTN